MTRFIGLDNVDRMGTPNACATCKWDERTSETGVAICAKFGWESPREARRTESLCGQEGYGWEAKPFEGYAATPMVERILG